MLPQGSLSNSKSPQFSTTLLSILSDLNNAVVWMVSTCPVISMSSSSCTNPLQTAPRATITIGIIVTLMFHSFFKFSSKAEVLILLFTFFQFYSLVSGDSNYYYYYYCCCCCCYYYLLIREFHISVS